MPVRYNSSRSERGYYPRKVQKSRLTHEHPRAKIRLCARKQALLQESIQELSSLPGIGEATAKRIIADRRAHGRFKKVEDLCRVKGIGKKKLASIKRYLRV